MQFVLASFLSLIPCKENLCKVLVAGLARVGKDIVQVRGRERASAIYC